MHIASTTFTILHTCLSDNFGCSVLDMHCQETSSTHNLSRILFAGGQRMGEHTHEHYV